MKPGLERTSGTVFHPIPKRTGEDFAESFRENWNCTYASTRWGETEAWRFVLIDEARRAVTGKRGGNQVTETQSSVGELAVNDRRLVEMLALDKALESLAEISPRLTKVVELRYYGGLEETEIAELLGVTERTVRRDWRKARAFLQKQLMDTGEAVVVV